jgi:hypothetical protein
MGASGLPGDGDATSQRLKLISKGGRGLRQPATLHLSQYWVAQQLIRE